MATITILPEAAGTDGVIYRAISGSRQSEGKTAGEALDALAAQLNEEESGTLVIVQNLRSDQFFTAQQKERLGELMTRWRSARDANETLPVEAETELGELIEAELKAANNRALEVSQELTQQTQVSQADRTDEMKVERLQKMRQPNSEIKVEKFLREYRKRHERSGGAVKDKRVDPDLDIKRPRLPK